MVEIDTMVGASDDDGGATVLCLQEVEEAYLEATLRPALADRGCGSLAFPTVHIAADPLELLWQFRAALPVQTRRLRGHRPVLARHVRAR